MRGVALDDHRAPGGQRAGGVAARRREGEREVAGAEDGHRPDGHEHAPHVGPRDRLGVGIGAVDDRLDVVAGVDDGGEGLELARGALELAAQAPLGEPGLGPGHGDDLVARGAQARGGAAQQRRAPLGSRSAPARNASFAAVTAAWTSAGVASSKVAPGAPVLGSTAWKVLDTAATVPGPHSTPILHDPVRRTNQSWPAEGQSAVRADRRSDRGRDPHGAAEARRAPAVRARSGAAAGGRALLGARGDRLAPGPRRHRDAPRLGVVRGRRRRRARAGRRERGRGGGRTTPAPPRCSRPAPLLEPRIAALAARHGRPDPYAEELLARMDRAGDGARRAPPGTKAIASSTARSPS